MKISSLLALSILIGTMSCSKSSTTSEGQQTYRMEKGGMSSAAHDMPAATATPEPDNKKGSRMEKGGMSSSGHEMK